MMIIVVALTLLATPTAALDATCKDLADGLTLRGRNVGAVLAEVCEAWPFTGSPFPVQTTSDAEALLNLTFKEGGLYDQAKKLAQERHYSGDFCWRKQEQRPVLKPSGYSCPMKFNKHFEPEKSIRIEPTEVDGQLYCIKNCSDVCGHWLNKGEVSTGLCSCRSEEPENIGTAGFHYIYLEQVKIVPAVPDGCDSIMTVNHSETCFGSCPNTTVPAFLVGNFKPVCSNVCNGTNRSFGCGFGCAVSAERCVSTVVDQVGSIVQDIGDTVGYISGNLEIASVTAAAVGTAEFGVTVLSTLVSAGITAWAHFEQDKQTVGLVAALLQVVKEVKADLPEMKDMFKQFVKMVREMIVALRGWHGMHWHSSLKEMSQAFAKHGPAILFDAYQLLDAFMWPTCSTNNSTPQEILV